jgi:glycogen synthase kinase 3 beta
MGDDQPKQPGLVRQFLPNERYKFETTLGVGTFGSVFRCKDVSTGFSVAVKKTFLDPRRKNRELDIIRKLKHPCCLRLLDSYMTEEGPKREPYMHLVTAAAAGALPDFIEANKRPAPIYLKLFGFQMFSALAYLHAHGVAHRDLKPSNVLVNAKTGELMLCDFGSAKPLKPGEISVSYIATRNYRAPELLLDNQQYTPAIDIWAAGCVLAEMVLENHAFFPGRNNGEVLARIFRTLGPPRRRDFDSFQHKALPRVNVDMVKGVGERLPKWVPRDLKDLLKGVWTYDPRRRPTAVMLMKHAFFAEIFDASVQLPGGSKLPACIRQMRTPEEMLRTWPEGPDEDVPERR